MQANVNQECEVCYYFDDDDGGVYECKTCHKIFCEKHRDIHKQETNHLDYISHCHPLDPEISDEIAENVHLPMVAGFQNLGNTCYFNSNLHVLFSIEEFVNFCLTDECDQLVLPSEPQISRQLGHQLHRFVTEFHKGNRLFLRPSLLRQAVGAEDEQYLLPYPQDSIDFFNYMMTSIRRRIGFSKTHLNLSEFNYIDEITCSNCSKTFSSRNTRKESDKSTDPFYCFIVKPKEHHGECEEPVQLNLDEMISERCNLNFQGKSTKDRQYRQLNWTCPNCGCHEGKIIRKIDRAPKYLYINNRLDHGSRSEDTRAKLDAVLQFDINNLDISNHVIEGNPKYQLIAFMHHFGRWAKWGHDISYVRKPGSDNVFYKFNDITVKEVDVKADVVFGRQYLYLFKQISS